tara:strand:- start:46 stop:624 length:579 start_codon:yes stop_codon:yes gene_type:complete
VKLKLIYENIVREAKQVGILYHYTSFDSAENIINSGYIRGNKLPDHDSISLSFTRDKNFHKEYREIGGDKGGLLEVRFVIDGNKLSNKFKIQPYAQTGYEKGTTNFESEEIILAPIDKDIRVSLKDYTISVDFLYEPLRDYGIKKPWEYINNINKVKKMGIPINIVDKNGNPVSRKERNKFGNWLRINRIVS